MAMGQAVSHHRLSLRNRASLVAVVILGLLATGAYAAVVTALAARWAGLAAIVALTGRAAAAGVIATPEALVVRNPWRTYRVAWSDVVRFEVGDTAAYPGTPLARVRGRRRPLVLWAVRDVGGLLRAEGRYAERAVAKLNEGLTRRRMAA